MWKAILRKLKALVAWGAKNPDVIIEAVDRIKSETKKSQEQAAKDDQSGQGGA